MAKLHYRYGAMGSSKTALALMLAYNFRERNKKVILAKPLADIRTDKIWSRAGLESDCISLESLCSMSLTEISGYDVIIVDEIQFASEEQVDFLASLVDLLEIPVFTYGLKTNAFGRLFPGSKRMIELADTLEECPSMCWCGAPAKFSARIDENGNVIREGEDKPYAMDGKYCPMCRKHYMSGKVPENIYIE